MSRKLYRLIAALARLAVRSGRSKDLEIIVLSLQLAVLRRQSTRPILCEHDRTLLGPGCEIIAVTDAVAGSVLSMSMPDDRLVRVIEMFRSRGNISDDVEGDTRATALAWLERASSELTVPEPILVTAQW